MQRAIIYFLFHPRGQIPAYVLHKLSLLKEHSEEILIVLNGEYEAGELSKLTGIAADTLVRENKGFDVGAYKQAIQHWRSRLANFDEVILMNYTWYGPIGDFGPLFKWSEQQDFDFWGVTNHAKMVPNPYTGRDYLAVHIQSHWIAVRKRMFNSDSWENYWLTMPEITSYEESVLKHESRFTEHFESTGFRYSVAFPHDKFGVDHPAMLAPGELIEDGCPVLKRRPFFHDPLYLDSEAVLGGELITLAAAKGYPEALIWADLLPITPPKLLNANTYGLTIVPEYSFRHTPFVGLVAAVVHIFYVDMTNELLDRISMVPARVELFITTDTEEKRGEIQALIDLRSLPFESVDIRVVRSNRGRDLSAYFLECADVVGNSKYELILKIHSKKTVQAGLHLGEYFKNQQLDNLLLSEGYVRNVFAMFEEDPQLGIVFPPMIHIGYPTLGNAWFANRAPAEKYAKEIGVTVPFDAVSPLAAFGAMWICRPQALKDLNQSPSCYEDYQSEKNHSDGSLAHVQERMVAYAAANRGYKTKTVANAGYAGVSHALLEYKLDQLMSYFPGKALDSRHFLFLTFQRKWFGIAGHRLAHLYQLIHKVSPAMAIQLSKVYYLGRKILGG